MRFFSDASVIAKTDVKFMLREKETLVWLFVMPIVFFYFIGTVTSEFGGGGGSRGADSIAVRAEVGAGFLADRVLTHLERMDYRVVRPETDEEFGRYTRRLIIPAGFTESVVAGEPTVLRFLRREGGSAEEYDRFRVSRAAYTTLADVVATVESGAVLDAEGLAALDDSPRALSLKVASAGERKRIPNGFEQTIPGIMVMFTMLAMLTSGAVILVIERQQGLLRRLASTPITRGAVVFGKWAGKLSLGVVQVTFAILAGTVLFSMDWGPSFAMVVVVVLSWAMFCASLGLWLGNTARTEGQAIGIGVLSSNVLAALGGCWWPIEITPEWMQAMQKFLPTGWAMDAMHRLISFQSGAASVVPHVLAMLGGAAVFGWLAARKFRFD